MALTKEQHEARRNWVGASESPCIVGVSPFGNACSVFCEKMGLSTDEPTIEMQLGNFLEEGIGRLYAQETKYTVAHFGSVQHARYPFMGCTPDLCVFGERRIAQIKLVGSWMAHHWTDGVPEYVELQVQHELEVCDADVADVVALIGGTDFRILPIQRDREIGAALVEICRGFWRDHIEAKQMPPVDGSEHASTMVRALYKQKTPAMILATSEIESWGRAWLDLDSKIEADKREQSRFEQLLKTSIGEAAGIEGEAFRVTWRESKNGKRPFLLKPIRMKGERAA